jgi:hypothetical protein
VDDILQHGRAYSKVNKKIYLLQKKKRKNQKPSHLLLPEQKFFFVFFAQRMAVDAAKALVPPQADTKDSELELWRLLRLTITMFLLSLFVAIILGFQIKRQQLQISAWSSTSFARLEHDAVLTIFITNHGQGQQETRDGVHGTLDTAVNTKDAVIGFHPTKWTYNVSEGSLQAEDGRYLVGYNHKHEPSSPHTVTVSDEPLGNKIALFVEPWSNRLFVHSGGFWLMRAQFDPKRGDRAHCVWTCSTQNLPEMYFGLWDPEDPQDPQDQQQERQERQRPQQARRKGVIYKFYY